MTDHLKILAQRCHRQSVQAGFWEEGDDRNEGEMIALMHSELSETLEAIRDDNPESEKIPGFSMVEEELADLIIRVLDYAHWKSLDLDRAIIAKLNYNAQRPYKHGREF